MGKNRIGNRHALYSAIAVAIIYFAVSLGWILFSDAAVATLARDGAELSRLQSVKGIAFISVMTLLLGVLFYHAVRARSDREQAHTLASTDPVTRLPNLLAFTEQLRLRVARGEPFAFILLDIKGFAGLNASLGREHGDNILRTIAGRLNRSLDAHSSLARLQADRFAVLTPDAGSPMARARVLVDGLGTDLVAAGKPVQLRLTAGVCEFPRDGTSVAQLMDAADIALAQSRHVGRPPVMHYEPDMQRAHTEDFLMESELRNGLRNGQLELHFQPQFEFASKTLVGAEALLRWNHPELGSIAPGRFIPVAEASGLIDRLSEFVLDTACRQLREWLDEGLDVVPVGVNIAGHQLTDLQLGVYVRDAAVRHGVPYRWLNVEVTESMAVHDPERGIELLNSLRELGVTIALDDFGTGYSSLKYLMELPVDMLKIDRSFISRLPDDAQRARFVKVIIDLGHDLGMRIVAEGVETEGQKKMLDALGCDYAQGYLFGRPVPVTEFRQWLVADAPSHRGSADTRQPSGRRP